MPALKRDVLVHSETCGAAPTKVVIERQSAGQLQDDYIGGHAVSSRRRHRLEV